MSLNRPLSSIHSSISFVSKVKVESLSPSLLITQASHYKRVFKFYFSYRFQK